jgi:hypothetical protein
MVPKYVDQLEAQEFAKDCLRQHEDTHWGQVVDCAGDWAGCDSPIRVPWNTSNSQEPPGAECAGWKKEIECLQGKIDKDCNNAKTPVVGSARSPIEDCKEDLRGRIRNLQKKGNAAGCADPIFTKPV